MMITWASEDGELYTAEQRTVGERGAGMVHATVESMGEVGWDWHVWDAAGQGQQQYGLADTLEEAQAKAERALIVLAAQFQPAA